MSKKKVRRLGRFEITHVALATTIKWKLRKLFGRMIVLQATRSDFTDSTEYVAESSMFAPLEDSETVPLYVIIVHEQKGKSLKFTAEQCQYDFKKDKWVLTRFSSPMSSAQLVQEMVEDFNKTLFSEDTGGKAQEDEKAPAGAPELSQGDVERTSS